MYKVELKNPKILDFWSKPFAKKLYFQIFLILEPKLRAAIAI
jgi:hypothetical protein